MIDINLSLLIQMANFLVFLFLMNLILYRPIRRIVAQRKKLMSDKQEEIERLEAGAAAAVQEYEQKLQESRRAGLEKIKDLKAAAYDEEKDLLRSISAEAAEQLQKMRAQVQTDIGIARDALKDQVKTFSAQLAQKILGRSI
jgi:F-type H+-transporting ATPase subunit b